MSKTMKIVLIIIAIILLLGGLFFFLESGDDPLVTNSENSRTSAQTSEAEIDQSNEQEFEEADEAATGNYVDYSEGKVAATNGNKVLFFHASWCPTCKSLDQNIRAGVVPSGLTIFKVNYDTERDLAKKYGVTYQHTLVQVDSDGNLITKWAGSYTIQQIIDELV